MHSASRMLTFKQRVFRTFTFHVVEQEKKRRKSYSEYIRLRDVSGQTELATRNFRLFSTPPVIAYPLP